MEERLVRTAEVILDGGTFDLSARILKTWTICFKNGIRLLDIMTRFLQHSASHGGDTRLLAVPSPASLGRCS